MAVLTVVACRSRSIHGGTDSILDVVDDVAAKRGERGGAVVALAGVAGGLDVAVDGQRCACEFDTGHLACVLLVVVGVGVVVLVVRCLGAVVLVVVRGVLLWLLLLSVATVASTAVLLIVLAAVCCSAACVARRSESCAPTQSNDSLMQ